MADSAPVTPPIAPAPKTGAGTPSMQGVTKPEQGEVPATGQGTPPGVVTLEHKDDQTIKATNEHAIRTGPTIVTSKTDSPFKVKQRSLEVELKALSDNRTRQAVEHRATINMQLEELRTIEAQRFSGANPRTPRGNLLRADQAQQEHPDLHLRYVNESIQGRADLLQSIGWQRLGGQGGDTVLWGIPREKWAEGERLKRADTERGLRKATSGSKDSNIEELQRHFDKEGVNVDVREVFGNARSRGDE